jgi:hypothetical protein
MIGLALTRLGVPREKLLIRWRGHAHPVDADGADGLDEASRRPSGY